MVLIQNRPRDVVQTPSGGVAIVVHRLTGRDRNHVHTFIGGEISPADPTAERLATPLTLRRQIASARAKPYLWNSRTLRQFEDSVGHRHPRREARFGHEMRVPAESNGHEANLPVDHERHHPKRSTGQMVRAFLASLKNRQPSWQNSISKCLKYRKPPFHVHSNQNYRTTYEIVI